MTFIVLPVICALFAAVSVFVSKTMEEPKAALLCLFAAALFALTSGGLLFVGAMEFAAALFKPLV